MRARAITETRLRVQKFCGQSKITTADYTGEKRAAVVAAREISILLSVFFLLLHKEAIIIMIQARK